MIKLLLVFLFILKTKSDNESNNLKMKWKQKRKLFDPRTDKPYSSINKEEKLFTSTPANETTIQSLSGRNFGFKPKKVLVENENIEIVTLNKYLRDMRNSNGTTRQIKRMNRFWKRQDRKCSTPSFPLYTKALRPEKEKVVETLNNLKKVKVNSSSKNSGTKSKSSVVNCPRSVGVVNSQEPEEIDTEERNGDELDENDISKYKPEKNLARNRCLKCPAKSRDTSVTVAPELEQADEGVTLIVTLLNMNCLRGRHGFDQTTTQKKVMTRYPSHCRKLTTKKMVIGKKNITEKCSGSTTPTRKRGIFQHIPLLESVSHNKNLSYTTTVGTKKGLLQHKPLLKSASPDKIGSSTFVGTKEGGMSSNIQLLKETKLCDKTLKSTTFGYC